MDEDLAVKIRNIGNEWSRERLNYARENYPEYNARIPFYFPLSTKISIMTGNRLYMFGITEPFGRLLWGGSYAAEFDNNDLPGLNVIDDKIEPKVREIWDLLGLPAFIVSCCFDLPNENDLTELVEPIKKHARKWVNEQITFLQREDQWVHNILSIPDERAQQLHIEIHETMTCAKYGLRTATVATACTAMETACLIGIEFRCGKSIKDVRTDLGIKNRELYVPDYLSFLEMNGIITEKTTIYGKALNLIRRTATHSKTGSVKEYTTSFVVDAFKDIINEILWVKE